jgi:hypothetical protein
MATETIGFGIALIVLGLGGYFGTGTTSLTALIPAAFGVVLAILGVLARNPAKRALFMHIAVVVGLLGFLGTAGGIVKTATLIAGGEVKRPEAAVAQAIMAILMLIFLVLCIRSFIAARRNRLAEAARG